LISGSVLRISRWRELSAGVRKRIDDSSDLSAHYKGVPLVTPCPFAEVEGFSRIFSTQNVLNPDCSQLCDQMMEGRGFAALAREKTSIWLIGFRLEEIDMHQFVARKVIFLLY